MNICKNVHAFTHFHRAQFSELISRDASLKKKLPILSVIWHQALLDTSFDTSIQFDKSI